MSDQPAPLLQATLEQLLVSLFDPEEFRRHLRLGPEGQAITELLPEGVSMRQLVHVAVTMMMRRGLVDIAFFDRLRAEFPMRERDILKTCSIWIAARAGGEDCEQADHARDPMRQPPARQPSSEITSMPTPPWNPSQRPDIAILIALPEEFRSLAAEYSQHWYVHRHPDHPGSDFLFFGPGGYRCTATIMPRMGPTVASEGSMRLLALRPAAIINIGIAGSIKNGDMRIGDVIVPRQVDAYDETAKIEGVRWQPRGSDYRPSASLVADVQQLEFTAPTEYAEWQAKGAKELAVLSNGVDGEQIAKMVTAKLLRTRPNLSTNHLASGSFVVASKDFAEFIRARNADTHAVEMEAAGMLAAAEYQRVRPETLVVRGISDHVDADKTAADAVGDGALRRLAMANAWRLVCTLMRLNWLPRANIGAGVSTDTSGHLAAGTPTALSRWQAKLAFLLEQEPITIDPDARFRLQHLIDEARAKIRDNGGVA